jgi:3-isopropylmalate dehydrogenase
VTKKILITSGDGIGPEVTAQGVKVLRAVAAQAGMDVTLTECLIGGAAIDATGDPLPADTWAQAQTADAILFGAAGGPKWDKGDFYQNPGKGLLKLRRDLKLFANLRLAKVFESAIDASPIKPERIRGADVLIVRELTGGIYFGKPRGRREEDGVQLALNTMVYRDWEVERIARKAFEIARLRGKRLTSVDKGNALEVGRFWRDIVERIGQEEYPDVALDSLYVDNAAMQIIRDPLQFDTMVMGNMFGDILSDAAGNLAGSLGMLPSASLGESHALYEPCHGSAPDIAGQDSANPMASILSVAMMFRYSFDRPDLETRIHDAVNTVLATHRTGDLMAEGKTRVGCSQMGDLVVQQLEAA